MHGIGGPDPGGVLGCEPGSTPVVSWRSEARSRSAVRRCAGENEVHLYHWSPLTSGSRTFALWPLLLPFTLVNLAGWMAPSRRRPGPARLHRAAAVVVGLATTAAASVWLVLAALIVWAEVGDAPSWLPGSAATDRFSVALASAAAAMGVLVLAATFAAAGFERFRPSSWGPAGRSAGRPWASLSARLDDPRFYDGGAAHATRWRVHVTVAVAALAAVAAAVHAGGTERSGEVVGRALLVVGAVHGVTLAAVVAAATGRDGDRRLSRRLVGAATATLGVILLGGLVLSATIALAGIGAVPPGPAAVLYDCYGWAALAGLAGVVVAVVNALLRRTPAESGPARALVPTIDARLRARLATVLSDLDVVVSGLAGGFAAAAGAAVAIRWSAIWDGSWRLTATAPVNIARSTFAFVLGAVVLNVIKSRASPAVLRRIGNIWDIVTFWPRAYHPFAVRPYAERAVPELQEFLRTAPRHGRLMVAAHSQGSVLAYAAVRPFVAGEGADATCSLPPFALVTFGSPLRALYAALFPHYFEPGEFDTTRRAIAGGWTNLFRCTDHVGRAVFTDDAEAVEAGAVGPDRPLADGDDLDGRVHGHNDYWGDPAVRQAVATGAATVA